jgi:hypothetical protein
MIITDIQVRIIQQETNEKWQQKALKTNNDLHMCPTTFQTHKEKIFKNVSASQGYFIRPRTVTSSNLIQALTSSTALICV